MNNKGFVKVPRSIFDEIYFCAEKRDRLSAYVDLLQMASYEDKSIMVNGRLLKLSRGQVASSIRFLESSWGWSKDKIVRFLKSLKSLGLIETSTLRGITIITFLDYDAEQNSREPLMNNLDGSSETRLQSFVTKYLNPDVITDNKGIHDFCSKYIIGTHRVPIGTSEFIKGLSYQDFLQTTYWQSISHSVKRMSDNACTICGSKESLEVHHKNYENHGNEVEHLSDLICVCHNCHSSIHNCR